MLSPGCCAVYCSPLRCTQISVYFTTAAIKIQWPALPVYALVCLTRSLISSTQETCITINVTIDKGTDLQKNFQMLMCLLLFYPGLSPLCHWYFIRPLCNQGSLPYLHYWILELLSAYKVIPSRTLLGGQWLSGYRPGYLPEAYAEKFNDNLVFRILLRRTQIWQSGGCIFVFLTYWQCSHSCSHGLEAISTGLDHKLTVENLSIYGKCINCFSDVCKL